MKLLSIIILSLLSTALIPAQEYDIWGVPTGKTITKKKISKENAPNAIDANGNKQGKWIKYDHNKIVYKGTFKNNKPIGEFLRYYPNGKLKAKQNFIAESNISYAKLYNEKGLLIADGKYIGSKKDSIWTWYSSKGGKLLQQTYMDDTLNGEQLKFFPNGRVYEKVNYVNGLKAGSVVRYYQDGQIRLKAHYKNDLLDGDYTTFLPGNGNKKEMSGRYIAGQKEGTWTIYNEQGIAYLSRTYVNDELKNKDALNAEQQKRFDEYESKAGTFQDPENYLENPTGYHP